MEYTFKNSTREGAQTVILSDYSIAIRSDNSERSISYANITSVRLCKITSSSYKMIIHHDGDKPLIITNQYLTESSADEDRSRVYSTFVRVLHYHLKDKSGAVYTSGCSIGALWKWGVLSVMLSFIISFTADYLGFGLMNPYAETLILTCLVAAVVFLLNVGQLPKAYTATDIPLNLLPEA